MALSKTVKARIQRNKMRRARSNMDGARTNWSPLLHHPALPAAYRQQLDATVRQVLHDFRRLFLLKTRYILEQSRISEDLMTRRKNEVIEILRRQSPEQPDALKQFMQRLFAARKKAKAQILSTQHNQEENTTKKESDQ